MNKKFVIYAKKNLISQVTIKSRDALSIFTRVNIEDAAHDYM